MQVYGVVSRRNPLKAHRQTQWTHCLNRESSRLQPLLDTWQGPTPSNPWVACKGPYVDIFMGCHVHTGRGSTIYSMPVITDIMWVSAEVSMAIWWKYVHFVTNPMQGDKGIENERRKWENEREKRKREKEIKGEGESEGGREDEETGKEGERDRKRERNKDGDKEKARKREKKRLLALFMKFSLATNFSSHQKVRKLNAGNIFNSCTT